MTDQKPKQPLKIGDKVWAEMVIDGIDREIECVAMVPSSTPFTDDPIWVGADGSWISRESPIDLLKQIEDLRNALEKVFVPFKSIANVVSMPGAQQMIAETELLLTKTKGSV